jgi:hypothetical protein
LIGAHSTSCAEKKFFGRGTNDDGKLLFALPTELPGFAPRAGLEPATEVTVAKHHRPRWLIGALTSHAERKSFGREQAVAEQRRPKPLDDLSLRSRQDSNLRLPRNRRSIRYLRHRPRRISKKLRLQKIPRRGIVEESLEEPLPRAARPAEFLILLFVAGSNSVHSPPALLTNLIRVRSKALL